MTKETLFQSFSPMSKAQWKAQATEDLKGERFEKRLVWQTRDNMTMEPYYNAEVVEKLGHLQGYQNQLQLESDWDPSPRRWVNLAPIITTDAASGNQSALRALNQGASGVEFQLSENLKKLNIDTLLEGISLPHITLGFSLPEGELDPVQQFIDYVKNQDYSLADLNGYVHCESIPDQIKVFHTLQPLPGFRGLVLESAAGTPRALSIGHLLAGGVKLLEEMIARGSKPEDLFDQILFRMYLANDYFREVARLRVLRILWHQIALEYGLQQYTPNDIRIQAITHINIRVKDDTHSNMLSNTGQAMAAVLGGCNLLSVTPHDQDLAAPNAFSQRMALNVSNLLKEEAYFDKVADPIAGSYFLETLIDEMTKKAWEMFQSEL